MVDNYVEMRQLWHPLPGGHLVPKPADAVMMADFFRAPRSSKMYRTVNGKTAGSSWTPYTRKGNQPPIIITPWADLPTGVSVPYAHRDEPEAYVPNKKEPGFNLAMSLGESHSMALNFSAMLKEYLFDIFEDIATPDLLAEYPTREEQRAYIDENWQGWVEPRKSKKKGKKPAEGEEKRDRLGKVKTLQYIEDQSKRRYPKTITRWYLGAEEFDEDGMSTTQTDDIPVDPREITMGARAQCFCKLDWVAFSGDGEIYLSLTATDVFVELAKEQASATSAAVKQGIRVFKRPAARPTLGGGGGADDDQGSGGGTDGSVGDGQGGGGGAGGEDEDEDDGGDAMETGGSLPMPPSAESGSPAKRAADIPESPSKRARADES